MADDIPVEGSVDKPYRENPPHMLKEVHWSGLAVHFGAGAGPEVEPPP